MFRRALLTSVAGVVVTGAVVAGCGAAAASAAEPSANDSTQAAEQSTREQTAITQQNTSVAQLDALVGRATQKTKWSVDPIYHPQVQITPSMLAVGGFGNITNALVPAKTTWKGYDVVTTRPTNYLARGYDEGNEVYRIDADSSGQRVITVVYLNY